MDAFISKVVISSTDPNRISLFIRGVLVSGAPLIMIVTGLDSTNYNALVDVTTDVVFLATSLVAASMMLTGLIRKVYVGRWSAAE